MKKTKSPKKTTKRATRSTQTVHMSESKKETQLNRKQAYYAVGLFILGAAFSFAVYQSYSPTVEETVPEVKTSNPSQRSENAPAFEETAQSCKIEGGPLAREFMAVQKMPMNQRIAYWSSYLEKNKNARKKIVSLAQGYTAEENEALVSGKFDSLKYVETVMALSRSSDSTQFVKNLVAIRYKDGKSDLGNRNYFIDADWIPQNQQSNILKDITAEVASNSEISFETEKNKIVRLKWLQALLKKKRSDRSIASLEAGKWSEPDDVTIPYIRLADLKKALRKLPQGSILNLVHHADVNHPSLITHHGFIIQEKDQTLFRHASALGQIRTHELSSYLQKLAKGNRKSAQWSLIGINVDQVNASSSESNCLSSEI